MELRETKEPGAVAELVFNNEEIHNFSSEEFELTFKDLTVKIVLDINLDEGTADGVTLTPEEGYIAVPDYRLVEEATTAIFYIYPLEGVGM